MSSGVIYLTAGGRSYLGELAVSLQSLRRHEPLLPVTVFSRRAPPAWAGCDFVPLDSALHPLKLKVLALRRSPYERTLFLDTDTLIRGPLQPVFAELNGSDFCAANSHDADWSVKPPRFIAMVKPGDYNTGVLVYRKSFAVLRFLEQWERAVMAQDPTEMWAGHFCDQHHFNALVSQRTLTGCGVAFRELDNVVYNCRGVMLDAVRAAGRERDIRILHHRTRGMKFRKLLCSLADAAALRELARKVLRRRGASVSTQLPEPWEPCRVRDEH